MHTMDKKSKKDLGQLKSSYRVYIYRIPSCRCLNDEIHGAEYSSNNAEAGGNSPCAGI